MPVRRGLGQLDPSRLATDRDGHGVRHLLDEPAAESADTDSALRHAEPHPVADSRGQACGAGIVYSHPLFDHAAVSRPGPLWRLQGASGTWFCGTYFGHGFHEDAPAVRPRGGRAARRRAASVDRRGAERPQFRHAPGTAAMPQEQAA